MKYNQLGNTGVLVPELCLGAMTFDKKIYWKIGCIVGGKSNIIKLQSSNK